MSSMVSFMLVWMGRCRVCVSLGFWFLSALSWFLWASAAHESRKLLLRVQNVPWVRMPGSFSLMLERRRFRISVCWMSVLHLAIRIFQHCSTCSGARWAMAFLRPVVNWALKLGSVRITRSDDFWSERNILSNRRSSSEKSADMPLLLVDANDSPDRGVADVMVAVRPVPLM